MTSEIADCIMRLNRRKGADRTENICKFLPRNEEGTINILNFVYETKKQIFTALKCETVYKLHLVIKGKGLLHMSGAVYELSEGDAFLTFPSVICAIESIDDFQYMYISFLGSRANAVMDKINIDKKNFIFRGADKLIPMWADAISDDKAIMHLRCEGLLLYSFSLFGEYIGEKHSGDGDIMPAVRRYIDENYTDSDLSLARLACEYMYSEKYISAVFKKRFHIGISDYITTLRIQHALTLMEEGYTQVKDIALRSGFSEPLYFSKVFKKRMGESPKEHIKAKAKD